MRVSLHEERKKREDTLSLLLERMEGRERNNGVREKPQLAASCEWLEGD